MIIRTLKKVARVSTLTFVAAMFFATVGISSASANQLTCAPNLIEYYANNLIVQCNGTNYYGVTAGCGSVQSLDTLKFWQSIAQGALLLAGKNIQIYFTPAAGGCSINTITALDLIK